jgi:hypothetical protein
MRSPIKRTKLCRNNSVFRKRLEQIEALEFVKKSLYRYSDNCLSIQTKQLRENMNAES